jgi:hypothetical protein
MGAIYSSTPYGVLRMRLNVSTRVPTEVTTYWSDLRINGF